MDLLLNIDGGSSTARVSRGYLAGAVWATTCAYTLAIRPGLPEQHATTWTTVAVTAASGAAALALLPRRRLRQDAALAAVVGGALALTLGVGAVTGQLLHYLVALALVFGYTGITCAARASLRVGVLVESAVVFTAVVGEQHRHLPAVMLGVAVYSGLGAVVGLVTTRLRQEHSDRERLNTGLVQLMSTTSVQAAAELAVGLSRTLLGVDGAAMLLADGPGATVFTGASGVGTGDRLVGVSVDITQETTAMGRSVSTAQPHFVADAPRDPAVSQRFVRLLDVSSVLYLPIRGEGGVLGVLAMWWSEPRRRADVQVDSALTLLSVELGQVLERHRQIDRLDSDAHADPLTGLGNRRRFDVSVAGMGPGGGVLLLDLDRFKPVNDTLGHDAGDLVLAEFARVLRRCARAGEACRIGGDQFAVVLPEDGVTAEALVADRLAQSWTAPHGVTYSLGFAAHDDASTPAATVRAADMALYAAKRARQHPARSL